MLNGYFDFQINSIVTPYVGFGLGWMKVKSSTGYRDTAMAWSGMAGISFRASQKVDVDVGYKYTYAEIAGDPNWKDHAVRVGLRLNMH